jgi:hypothetical protein
VSVPVRGHRGGAFRAVRHGADASMSPVKH